MAVSQILADAVLSIVMSCRITRDDLVADPLLFPFGGAAVANHIEGLFSAGEFFMTNENIIGVRSPTVVVPHSKPVSASVTEWAVEVLGASPKVLGANGLILSETEARVIVSQRPGSALLSRTISAWFRV